MHTMRYFLWFMHNKCNKLFELQLKPIFYFKWKHLCMLTRSIPGSNYFNLQSLQYKVWNMYSRHIKYLPHMSYKYTQNIQHDNFYLRLRPRVLGSRLCLMQSMWSKLHDLLRTYQHELFILLSRSSQTRINL